MFRIRFYRDITNKDPKKRRKIRGIIFYIGRACTAAPWCDKCEKCRYRNRYRFHNLSIRFHDYMLRTYNIKLPYLTYFQRWDTNLSGTTKCPFHKSRRYSCWDCKNQYGLDSCRIEWQSRGDAKDPDWPTGKCGAFDPWPEFLNWNKRTGEIMPLNKQ